MLLTLGCFRGKLPPREFYRLVASDSMPPSRAAFPPPLTASIAIASYETPGIYGSGSIVYRVGASSYGAYPSRDWAIPLGEMLGALTEGILRRSGLTSGEVLFDPALPRRGPYEWRGVVREFDEVDAPSSVSASVSLTAQLVRVSDDSVLWSGSVQDVEVVREPRKMESVVSALSIAATRAVTRLTDDAGAVVRRLAASGARTR